MSRYKTLFTGTRTVEWQDVPGASLYAAQYRTAGGQFEEDKSMVGKV